MAEDYNSKDWAQAVDVTGWYCDESKRYYHRYPNCYLDRGVFECKKCGRRFPDQYGRSMGNYNKSRRGGQYFKLAAWNNFKKHLDRCREAH